jgi:acetyl esterase/lipase
MSKITKFQCLLFLIIFALKVNSQEVIKLWEGQDKPFYKENNLKEYEKEVWGTKCVTDVTEPAITVYKAKGQNTGMAVVILPGGGYTVEAIYHEGHDLAKVLSEQGITAAVLKYRLPNPLSSDQPQLVPWTDAKRALKLLRLKASKYGINKNKVGIIGFSAGSHLATITSLWKTDDQEEKPNFTGLIYGVTLPSVDNIKWLEESLYFRKMTPEEIAQNDLIKLVTSETAPTFLAHAYDDDVCKIEESTQYAQKLFENKVPVEMHLFTKGRHGFGMGRKSDGTNEWVILFVNWLKNNIM